MSVYHGNLERITQQNRDYRRVLYTAPQLQLVVMSLQPGDTIPFEVHGDHDQFIRVEEGRGRLEVSRTARGKREKLTLQDGTAVVIPAGVFHEVINTSRTKVLKLYTLYTPPEHPQGLVQRMQHMP